MLKPKTIETEKDLIRKAVEDEFDPAFLAKVFDDDRIVRRLLQFDPDKERDSLIGFIKLVRKETEAGKDLSDIDLTAILIKLFALGGKAFY